MHKGAFCEETRPIVHLLRCHAGWVFLQFLPLANLRIPTYVNTHIHDVITSLQMLQLRPKFNLFAIMVLLCNQTHLITFALLCQMSVSLVGVSSMVPATSLVTNVNRGRMQPKNVKAWRQSWSVSRVKKKTFSYSIGEIAQNPGLVWMTSPPKAPIAG